MATELENYLKKTKTATSASTKKLLTVKQGQKFSFYNGKWVESKTLLKRGLATMEKPSVKANLQDSLKNTHKNVLTTKTKKTKTTKTVNADTSPKVKAGKAATEKLSKSAQREAEKKEYNKRKALSIGISTATGILVGSMSRRY